MTPEKDIKKIVTRMTGVTEQQIVQRMHEQNVAIEARNVINRSAVITESQPPPAESRIETTEQSLQARPFTQGTGAQQGGAGQSSGSSTPATSVTIIVNDAGTPTYMLANGQLGDPV